MTHLRKREADAILELLALPIDDWGSEHWSTFDVARAHLMPVGQRIRTERGMAAARTARKRPKRKPEPRALIEGRRAVRERSGGRCEHPSGCAATAEVVHHRAGRVGKGAHHPDLLMHLCDDHHRWVHAHPAESYADGSMVRRNGIRFDIEEETP